MGQRSLANVCLRYLGALDDAPARTRAIQRYDRAGNMTDAIAALAAVKDSGAPDRDDLFARFEARWRDEPLVLDKWFALQARSQRDDALARVKSLLTHPRFNVKNPNRVRSLVGAFALGNFMRFHAADGSGYAFTADQVLALDPANPQLASALAGAFNLWKRFAEPRRGAMERALHPHGAHPGPLARRARGRDAHARGLTRVIGGRRLPPQEFGALVEGHQRRDRDAMRGDRHHDGCQRDRHDLRGELGRELVAQRVHEVVERADAANAEPRDQRPLASRRCASPRARSPPTGAG